MSLIVKQSFLNILIILFAFTLGALNTLFFYPSIIGTEFYGIILILLLNQILFSLFFLLVFNTALLNFFLSRIKKEKDKILIHH